VWLLAWIGRQILRMVLGLGGQNLALKVAWHQPSRSFLQACSSRQPSLIHVRQVLANAGDGFQDVVHVKAEVPRHRPPREGSAA
jgi:hypothetical protein